MTRFTKAYLEDYSWGATSAMFNNFMGLNQNHSRNWDSSWIHLMEVVEKIESTGCIVRISQTYCFITDAFGDSVVGRNCGTKIDATFRAVADYLALIGIKNEFPTPFVEENKLIAEFMGMRVGDNEYSHGSIDYHLEACDLKFHSSWDWIMPVYTKIRQTKDEGVVSAKIESVFTDVDYGFEKDSILSLWALIVEYLKWYSLR